MFLSDDPKDYDPLEQIENRANPPATSVGMPLALVALSGGAGLAVGGAVVGGSLAALPAYFLVKKMGKVWTNNVFLRRNPGCYAHLIRSDRDMVQWIEAHGKDDVADQLRVALIQRQRLTSCAKRTAKLLIAPESLPPKNVAAYLTAETPAVIDSSNPRSLKSASPTAETSTPQTRQETGQRQDERSLFVHLADNPFLCWFILASQRTGKTSSAAAASLTIKREHGTEVYYINLSDHGQGNREAFAHADRAAIGDINGSNSGDAARLIQAAIAVVEQFHQSNNAILVVDEWVNLALKVRAGMDEFWAVLSPKAAALTSNGIGCGRSVWAIAPTFQAATMREDAKVVKSFVPLILSVAPGQTIDWSNPESGVTSKLPYNGALIGQAARNWPDAGIVEPTAEDARRWQRDGVSRVFWADKRWSPLGQAPAIPKSVPAPTYEVVTAAATIEPSTVDAALPDLYQAIAHMTLAQAATETPDEGTDPEYRIWSWVYGKLARFDDGLTVARLWSDAPNSIKKLCDREQFDRCMNSAIEVGLLMPGEGEKLLANPDEQP
jgi:hypothetical protein